MSMLRREVLLTRAKLHGLCYDQIMGERRLRSLKTQLRQVGSGFLDVCWCTTPCGLGRRCLCLELLVLRRPVYPG